MRSRSFLIHLVSAAACAICSGAEISFWVWNRASPLAPDEVSALQALNVGELFWHVGELENQNGEWRWRRPPLIPPPCALHLVPVIRLDPAIREPFAGAALGGLIAKLKEAVAGQEWTELQIDCDAPDRLLGSYANALSEIHRFVPRLSVTALAGWSRSPHWADLQKAVDEIFPMFYDLESDPAGVGKNAAARPLLNAAEIDAQLQDWSACRIPWRAGLPNFARLTVYNQSGKSRGHIRSWNWNEVGFNRALGRGTMSDPATVFFSVTQKTNISSTPVAEGESLAARWPERAVLAHALRASEAAGARGVVYFKLPNDTASDGWSLAQLRELEADGPPRLELRRTTNSTFCLTNDSGIDLPPRLAGEGGERDRGYALEIEGAIWREALAGDFWRVSGHAHPEANPVAVPIALATRLTFWFSALQAGRQLTTGLMQTAPGADQSGIRYRILNLPGAEVWRDLK